MIPDDHYEVDLPVVPISKGRVRITQRGAYTPQRTQQAEAEYRTAFEALDLPLHKDPLKVTVIFFKDKVRLRVERADGQFVKSPRGDVDNLLKTIGDALNGVAWVDDKIIVHWDARKAKRGEE